MTRFLPGVAPLLACVLAEPTYAACQTHWAGILDLGQNSRLTMHSDVDLEGCIYSFTLHSHSHTLGQTKLEHLELMNAPKNGNLEKMGSFTFFYKPNTNFKGKDNFILYVCGSNLQGKGCSRVSYDLTVK